MQLLVVDRNGLTISGAILHFAWTKDAPRLFESANGNLGLYFRARRTISGLLLTLTPTRPGLPSRSLSRMKRESSTTGRRMRSRWHHVPPAVT